MKIAIATKDFIHVAGHAGQSRHWLLYDSEAGAPEAQRVTLDKSQVFHHWEEAGSGPHPLDGIEAIIAGSAGDGFLRRMQARGIEVLLTGETDAAKALAAVLAGEVLPDPRFNPSLLLCKLRDIFSKH
jgi:predicted Fe-Mo cluster-binding NifX family protein